MKINLSTRENFRSDFYTFNHVADREEFDLWQFHSCDESYYDFIRFSEDETGNLVMMDPPGGPYMTVGEILEDEDGYRHKIKNFYIIKNIGVFCVTEQVYD